MTNPEPTIYKPPEDPLWYKDAVFYEVHVRAFCDSNGDGTGDFRGFAQKLDYLQDLGVNTIWLLPFYPSPLKDDGYDIADYSDIHPSYGTLEDFQLVLDQAHRRGMRVLTELVMNHTSDQHPWFQEARQSKNNPRRDWYVWSDTPDPYKQGSHHLCRHRTLQLGLGPGFQVVLLAPVLQPPTRSEL